MLVKVDLHQHDFYPHSVLRRCFFNGKKGNVMILNTISVLRWAVGVISISSF